jgi:hypothetical protein
LHDWRQRALSRKLEGRSARVPQARKKAA